LSVYAAIHFGINFNVDLTLISIAMIFPLVFTIRGSFRRREKALEHLSQFRSSLKTLYYYVVSNDKLSEDDKNEFYTVLLEISKTVLDHLGKDDYNTDHLDEVIQKVHEFMKEKDEFINDRLKNKIFRFMADLHESVENLHAINSHRTPISLRAYCKVFIYIFPLLYAPIIFNNVGFEEPQWIIYSIVLITEFILISLYNIQDKLEYPFDNDGLDDIKLDIFKLSR